MADYLDRTRRAFNKLFGSRRAIDSSVPPAIRTPLRDGLALTTDGVTFLHLGAAQADYGSWLDAFAEAAVRNTPVSPEALTIIEQAAGRYSAAELLAGPLNRQRLHDLLRPRPGLAMRLTELQACGLLGRLFPEFYAVPGDPHPLTAVGYLERLPGEATLVGERFGTMLGELTAPDLLVLSLLLHHVGKSKHEHRIEDAARMAHTSLESLHLPDEARQMVEFLIRNQRQMSQIAFRQDTGDPEIIATFAGLLSSAALFNTFKAEELLQMLCLLTIADLGAMDADALTPWKAELLWRLFVDTYNQLTMAYGDEVIDKNAAARTALHASRPADISEAELTQFLEGLPRRYLTLFASDSIYQHVRLSRNMGPTDVHFFLNQRADSWELTVVTLDKPGLFSKICGLLSYLDMDILRGQALTSLNALVVDVFEFTDRAGFLKDSKLDSLLLGAVAGEVDLPSLLREKARHAEAPSSEIASPVIYFDNESSRRYTVLEVVAGDAPGLLYRVSRSISDFGCEVDLVLISTEGDKAIDVFHLRKGGAKLTDSDQVALTEVLERMLEGELA